MKKFVRDVFYTVVPDDRPGPRHGPGRLRRCESITFGNLNFGFDKFQITKEMEPATGAGPGHPLKDSTCRSLTITATPTAWAACLTTRSCPSVAPAPWPSGCRTTA